MFLKDELSALRRVWAGWKYQLPEASALLTVLALALMLRLTFVTGMVFFDDVAYAQAAHDMTKGIVRWGPWAGLPRVAIYMPVALLYALFSVSDTTTLAWPLFCSLLGVASAYVIGRLVAGEAAGLLAGFLWAIFPLDIQMATALLPDAPLATFTAGTVLFFLLGERLAGRRAYISYVFSTLCLIVAMLLKPLAMIILTFLAAYLIWKRPRRTTWLIVAGILVIAGALFFYYSFVPGQVAMIEEGLSSQSSSSLSNTLAATATDWFVNLIQSRQLFFFVPLFIVAMVSALISSQGKTTELALWGGITFLYFELGTMSLRRYLPIPSDMMLRQVLLVMVPFVVLAGIYLARGLSVGAARQLVVGLSVVMGGIAWWGTQYIGNVDTGSFNGLSGIGNAMAIYGAVASPLFVMPPVTRWKQSATSLILLALAMAALNPIQKQAVSNIHTTNKYLKQASEYLRAHTIEYPVLAQDAVLAARLDYQSGFQFGFDQFQPPSAGSRGRLRVAPDAAEQVGNAYVLVDRLSIVTESWRKYHDYLLNPPPSWVTIARWGNDPYPLYLYQTLTPDRVAQELRVARAVVVSEPSEGNLRRLLQASLMADDACTVALAWQRLGKLSVNVSTSIQNLRGFLTRCYADHREIAGANLFQDAQWGQDPAWKMALGEQMLHGDGKTVAWHFVRVEGDDTRTIAQGGIELRPNTAYVYEATVKSMTTLTTLYMEVEGTNGALEREIVHPEWINLSMVFVTPNWDSPRRAAFFPVLLTGAGEVWIRDVRLASLDFEGLQ